jgi:two-component system, NarL family, invasion response regulator UvrY
MKILLCDDHPVVRNGLKNVFIQLPDTELIEEANNGIEALDKLSKHKFDVIVLDLSLPDINGIDLIERIKEKHPAVNVLILTQHAVELFAVQAINTGALCYLTKSVETSELIKAIRIVAKGKEYLIPEVGSLFKKMANGDKSIALHLSLSVLEYDVLIKFGSGKSRKEIAGETHSPYKAVSAALHDMMEKMGFKKKSEITPYCIKYKLIENL